MTYMNNPQQSTTTEPITSVITLHKGTFSTQYTADGALQTATVKPSNDNGYIFQDHDSSVTFDYLDDALAYLFDLYGIE